jgi:hypothetical protein
VFALTDSASIPILLIATLPMSALIVHVIQKRAVFTHTTKTLASMKTNALKTITAWREIVQSLLELPLTATTETLVHKTIVILNWDVSTLALLTVLRVLPTRPSSRDPPIVPICLAIRLIVETTVDVITWPMILKHKAVLMVAFATVKNNVYKEPACMDLPLHAMIKTVAPSTIAVLLLMNAHMKQILVLLAQLKTNVSILQSVLLKAAVNLFSLSNVNLLQIHAKL